MGLRDRLRRGSRAPAEARGASFRESTVSSRSLLDDGEVSELSRFVNIAFVGAKDTGKSSLINAVVGIHIAGGRDLRPEGSQYRHPVIQEVLFHEISTAVGVRKDYRAFNLVVIVFQASVKDADMEVALRALECKVPVLFVHPKADLALKRVALFQGASTKEAVRKTRASINDRPDMRWFQMKEVDRKVYSVCCPDLMKRNNNCIFDEMDFFMQIEAIYKKFATNGTSSSQLWIGSGSASSNLMTGSGSMGSALSRSIGGVYVSGSLTPSPNGSTDRSLTPSSACGSSIDEASGAIPYPVPSKGRQGRPSVPRTRCGQEAKALSPPPVGETNQNRRSSYLSVFSKAASQRIGGFRSALDATPDTSVKKVAFVEENNSGKATLLEAFLGMKSNVERTITASIGYKHAEHPGALFYYFDTDDLPIDHIKDHFANKLASMDLVVLVYTRRFPEVSVKIAQECKKFGIRFICAHARSVVATDGGSQTRYISPRAMFRKMKSMSSTSANAKASLTKGGLRQEDFAVFQVTARILRLPDSYPRADEEDFKACIAEACGSGRYRNGPYSPGSTTAGVRTPSEPTGSRSASILFGSPIRTPTIIPPSPSMKGGSPPSALKASFLSQSGRGTNITPKGTPNSVSWLNPHTCHVGVVGRKGVGKSTLINGTFNQQVAVVNKPHERQTHRHPGHYDLLFEDFPGFDASIPVDRWIQSMRLGTLDWIVIVFQQKLAPFDLAVAQFADRASLPVTFVATAADLMVDADMNDEGLVEKAAVERTRCRIVSSFRKQQEEAMLRPSPIWIVSGRALCNQRRTAGTSKLFSFDERGYLEFVDNEIASSLA